MDTAWSRILNQIKSISTEIYTSINAPADPAEMLLLEKTIGVNLPHAFQDYLSTMNGQKNTEENTRDRNTEALCWDTTLFFPLPASLKPGT